MSPLFATAAALAGIVLLFAAARSAYKAWFWTKITATIIGIEQVMTVDDRRLNAVVRYLWNEMEYERNVDFGFLRGEIEIGDSLDIFINDNNPSQISYLNISRGIGIPLIGGIWMIAGAIKLFNS